MADLYPHSFLVDVAGALVEMVDHLSREEGLKQVFPARPESAGAARSWAIKALVGFDDDLVDTVTLLLSELVTNAYRHGRQGKDAEIDVKLVEAFGDLVCRVGNDAALSWPRLRAASDSDEGGRGLALVALEANSWGSLDCDDGRIWMFFSVKIPKPLPADYQFPSTGPADPPP